MQTVIIGTGTNTTIYEHGSSDALRVDEHYRDGELVAATCEIIDGGC